MRNSDVRCAMLPGIRFSILELLWLLATLSVSLGAFIRLAEWGGIAAWGISTLLIAICGAATREGISPGVRAAACMTAGGLGAAMGAIVVVNSPSVHPVAVAAVGLATGASCGLLLARRQVIARRERPTWRDYVRLYVGSVLLSTIYLASLPMVPAFMGRIVVGVVFGLLAATAISAAVFLGSRFSGTKELTGQAAPDEAKEEFAAVENSTREERPSGDA